MEFSIKARDPEKQRTACAVVGVYEQHRLSAAAAAIDGVCGGLLGQVVQRGDMEGKAGSTLMLPHLGAGPCERVLLVGLGKAGELNATGYRDALRAALHVLEGSGAGDAVCYLTGESVAGRDPAWNVEQAVLAAGEVFYRFDQLKSKKESGKRALRKLGLWAAVGESAGVEAALARGRAIVAGVDMAKDLGNLPGNHCTPSYLAEQARALGKSHGLKVQVLEQKDMEKLGMGTLLAVARGSHEPPKFIVLKYNGADKDSKPVVLVGKGITFDTGGISLKPPADMDEMKYDMSGAGSVLGTLRAVAELGLPLNVVGLIPTCENMPNGRATKPGDIVTSMSGQTVEILNTDAEGRLILCDALTYAERFEPAAVVDVATLTGACVIALGHVISGLLANDDDLAREVQRAGDAAWDRCWQLPLLEDYQEQLKSNFADMANIGGRPGGTITAAAFLSRYTKKYPWAHLDVAGTAYKSGKHKGSTGRPVPLLVHFLAGRAEPR